MIRSLIKPGLLLLGAFSIHAQTFLPARMQANEMILSLLNSMPRGGGYSVTAEATRELESAVRVRAGRLDVNPFAAQTTYCSGATYVVFVRAIQLLLPASHFGERLAQTLAITGQPDGVGIWGRWNANGPGTACLFHELALGPNFTSFETARPGDFMKIFWTGAVGAREHGHSVIYLGRDQSDGSEKIRFWSSNKPGGYGEKLVPRSRIAYAIFSRLEVPSNIERALNLPLQNRYLVSLTTKDSSISEALTQSGTAR